jgi:hypothetical protein
MRKTLIFILALPLLVLAVIWFPLGILFDLVISPIWGSLAVIYWLRGDGLDLGVFALPPLIPLLMWFEVTGFCPRLAAALDPI